MSFLNNVSNRVGSTVNDKLGNVLAGKRGEGEVFRGNDTPLYEKFLYNILADVNNSVTESAYWVVFFSMVVKPRNPKISDVGSSPSPSSTSGPPPKKGKLKALAGKLKKAGGGYLKSEFGIEKQPPKPEPAIMDIHPWMVGKKSLDAKLQLFGNIENSIMLVQGIDIPGDGFTVSKPDTMNVGGFLKPAIGGMRNDLPEIELAFLENNSSVTDLAIRPWLIEASYRSLKFAPKAHINCYKLTRSPSGFRVRKHFTFYNACPISVDNEQYTYTAMNAYAKRKVKFTFTDYSISEGESMTSSFFGKIKNFVGQKVRGLVTNVAESGTDVLAGGANQVFTNVKGQLVNTFNDHAQNMQSKVREFGKNAEDTMIDGAQGLINKTIGFHPDKDSLHGPGLEFSGKGVDNNPAPRIEVKSDNSDKLASPPIPPRSSGVSNNVQYTIIKTEGNDTPDVGGLNLQEVNVSNGSSGVESTTVSPPENDAIRR